LRPQSLPTNRFQFGGQVITTRVFVMAPRGPVAIAPSVRVTASLDSGLAAADPFEEVELYGDARS
jgi:hypothetical protein